MKQETGWTRWKVKGRHFRKIINIIVTNQNRHNAPRIMANASVRRALCYSSGRLDYIGFWAVYGVIAVAARKTYSLDRYVYVCVGNGREHCR